MATIEKIKENSAADRKGYEKFLDYFANYVVQAAIFLHITPTQISFFWVIAQFFTPFLFLLAEYKYFVLGIVLFQLMFIVDLSDGKLFRHQKSGQQAPKPLFPKYLDRLGHSINNSWLLLLLGMGTSQRFGSVFFFYLGATAAGLYLLNKAITINPSWYKSSEEQLAAASLAQEAAPRHKSSLLKQFLFDFTRIEHLGNVLFFLIILDWPQYALYTYVGIYGLEFIRKLFLQGAILYRLDQQRR